MLVLRNKSEHTDNKIANAKSNKLKGKKEKLITIMNDNTNRNNGKQ